MANGVTQLKAPDDYTPEFCDAIRAGCQQHMRDIKENVEKVDSRIFTLVLLVLGNLAAGIGSLLFYVITREDLIHKVDSVVKMLK